MAVVKRLYRVADHVFGLSLPAEWEAALSNYAPFLIEEGDPLFRVEILEDDYTPPANLEHVYTDRSDEDMPRIELYHEGPDWLFGVSKWRDTPICCYIAASADFSQATLHILPDCNDVRFAIDNAAMLLFAFATSGLQTLEMHASVTVRDGYAQLFLGHSGTGKSTHSRLWQEAYPDAWLLNDDNPVLRVLPDGEVRVYGSPWSGKTPCYKNQSAPVRGIVKLSQAPHNEIRLLRLPEAYAYMLASSSGLKIVPEMMDCLYETIAKTIQLVPVYGLECLPNTDAARLCHDTLTK